MKIGFYPRYSQLGASSRYRFYMYFQRYLAENGSVPISIADGFSDRYLQTLYREGRVSRWRQFREFMHMLMRSLHLAENLIIEYELVPNLPWKYEQKLIGKRPYILNFDDNVWEKYRNNRSLQDKYDQLCRNAAGVITANYYLTEKVRPLNDNICQIPTVVDLDMYRQAGDKNPQFTIVWIGTPVTYMYLEQRLKMLQMLTADGSCELLVIADANLGKQRPLHGVRARYVDWSSDGEVDWLCRSHIGIMPLADDAFSRGKSAFKLLQYQAAGLPVVASPVGENNFVVENGQNGFLASGDEDFVQACRKLQHDHILYRHCHDEALKRAYDYSIQKYFTIFKNFVEKTFDLPRA